MATLIQGSNTVQQFYQEVYSHLTLILNKISCMNAGAEAIQLLTKTYRDKALDTFVRGLRGDLPRLLGVREPSDLPQALHLCLKMENQNFRTNQAHSSNKMVPPPPPRRNSNNPQQQFYPQLAYFPQDYRKPQFQSNYRSGNQQFPLPPQRQYNFNPPQQQSFRPQYNTPTQQQYSAPPPRPFQPKPPIPMDVDRSLQTRAINYTNRPQDTRQSIRRQAPISNQPQPKLQRINQIDSTEIAEEQQYVNEHYFERNAQDQEQQSLEEYVQEYSNAEKEGYKEMAFSDIHFLD